MNKQNRELIEELFNTNYGWAELEELSEDILEWVKKDKKRYYSK
jgi:hypothetical protein